MNMKLLSSLACICCLTSLAFADLRQGSSWLQGPNSQGFGFARLDLDDESREVTLIVDFQGLSSLVVQGRLIGQSGELLCTLAPQSTATGVAFGSAILTPSDLLKVILSQTRVVLDTTLQPQGEVDGPVSMIMVNYSYPMSPAQLSPSPASNAYGSGFVFEGFTGNVGFSGQLTGLQGSVTSIEIWRSAWYGQPGKHWQTVTLIGHPNPLLVTYNLSLPPLNSEEHRDLHDGMCYVIVKTSLFPEGELRGQIRGPTQGDRYCQGRANSVTNAGAVTILEYSPLAADNQVRLLGTSLPPNKIVLPLVGFGSSQTFAPGGLGGILCVGGAGIGRLGSYAAQSNAQGIFDATLDLSSFSIGGNAHSLQPGMRLNFQLWYRDPQGPTGSNFSSATSTVFH